MLSQEYPNDYIVSSLDKRLIIIIIYNKNTFSINDSCRKFWNHNSQKVLQPPKKKKGLWYQIFYYHS